METLLKTIAAVIGEFWGVLSEMSPYLVFGFLVAGILSVSISARMVQRHLGGNTFASVLKASLFGVPLPLCSCGVIPVAASLRRNGAGRGATASFLLSTPQTGVDSIFVTLSLLGPVFALFRALAALASGIVGGSLVAVIESDERSGSTDNDGGEVSAVPAEKNESWIVRALKYGFVTLPQDIGRPMLAGLVIAGIITVAVPQGWLSGGLGSGILAKLIMMALGIPIYVCATASVPIAAALVAKGVSPGAALVFLMTGPATNAAAIAVLWKMLGRRTAFVYLGTVAVLSLVFGMILDMVFSMQGGGAEPSMGWMIPPVVKTVCSVFILALLLRAVLRPFFRVSKRPAMGEGVTSFRVGGMTCSHCAETVRGAAERVDGVVSAEVDLDSGILVVTGDNVDSEDVCRAVSGAGYSASVSN